MAYTNVQRTTQTKQAVLWDAGHRPDGKPIISALEQQSERRQAGQRQLCFFWFWEKPGLQIAAHLWKKFSLQHLSIWELQLYLSMYGKRLAAIVHITRNTIGRWKNDLYYWRRKVY